MSELDLARLQRAAAVISRQLTDDEHALEIREIRSDIDDIDFEDEPGHENVLILRWRHSPWVELYVADNGNVEVIRHLMFTYQDFAIEDFREARPSCLVGHPHPARATVVDDAPAWLCPADGTVVALVE